MSKKLPEAQRLSNKKAQTRSWYIRNQEKILLKAKQYRQINRDRLIKQDKLEYKANPDKWWAYSIKKKYNLTVEGYTELLDKQNGVCAICKGGPGKKGIIKFSVDHNHSTGQVRGLLCSPCNVALGLLKENIDTLGKMISYLTYGGVS